MLRCWRLVPHSRSPRLGSQLILTRTQGRLFAILRGPETRATTAPVPPDAEFLGLRFTLETVLRPHPAASVVDGYVSFPVTDPGRVVIGGKDGLSQTAVTQIDRRTPRPRCCATVPTGARWSSRRRLTDSRATSGEIRGLHADGHWAWRRGIPSLVAEPSRRPIRASTSSLRRGRAPLDQVFAS
nr:hypothetical protein [uncultured Actinoplanes sp.]